MKRYLLGVVLLSGCMWGAFANLLAPSDHNCACYPDKTTKQWFMCDHNGQRKKEGPYMCCGATRADGTICGKKCMRMGSEEEQP